ncbi:MAG: hypothetical protein BAJALOKI1v1_630013 [Promethearchaeota archaeon]|nr:MAG: hypothetical protein BAJALOKI1v1_630013 [Candidatus Lokiarchaeota archaeon]
MPFDVSFNEKKNRLYYNVDGFISNDDVDEILEAMNKFLAEHEGKFTALINMREFKVSEDVKEAIKSIQQIIQSGKLIADAFIVTKSAIGKTQFDKITRDTKTGTERRIFTREEDAERWLDSLA